MATWLNCVFWNIQDARHPQQRSGFIPKLNETQEAKQAREAREANNGRRAVHLSEAIVSIARLERIDLFLFAEYHLDRSMIGGDNALCKRLEQETGRQFLRIENRQRSFSGNGAPKERKNAKHITIFSSLEPRPGSNPGQLNV